MKIKATFITGCGCSQTKEILVSLAMKLYDVYGLPLTSEKVHEPNLSNFEVSKRRYFRATDVNYRRMTATLREIVD